MIFIKLKSDRKLNLFRNESDCEKKESGARLYLMNILPTGEKIINTEQ